MKPFFTFVLAMLLSYNSNAQIQHIIDSLESALKNHHAAKLELQIKSNSLYDTTEANILNRLSQAYGNINQSKAIELANESIQLSEQIGFKIGIANAYFSLGIINVNKGNFLIALKQQEKALNIRKELGDKKSISYSYNIIGRIYYGMGKYPDALKYNFESLKLAEEIKDKVAIISSHLMIGNIYDGMDNETEALKNLEIAYKMANEIGNKNFISASSNNIGEINRKLGHYNIALSWYAKAMKLNQEIGNKQFLSINLINIADVHLTLGNYLEAIKYNLSSLKISEEIEDNDNISNAYINIGAAYTFLEKYKEASIYLNKGMQLSKEVGALECIKKGYENLASLDSAQGNFKSSMEHYKLYIKYRDSILNNENTEKAVTLKLNYEFDKFHDSTNAEQVKKDLLSQKELQKQKMMRNGFVGGFGVMLLFAGVFFTQRNNTKKQKIEADIQRDEANRQRERSDELLLNILPEEVAEELKSKGSADAKHFEEVTVMFTDFKNFTQISEKLSPKELVAEIHSCFKAFDEIIGKHNIEKIKTIGDSYMCAGGLPVANTNHTIDIVNCAIEIQQFMQQHILQQKSKNKEIFEIRIGIHTGPIVAGIVGVKKFAYDIWGDTVNIASRMESSGESGRINISGSTYTKILEHPDTSKGKYTFIHRGKNQVKNKGDIDMYFIESSA